jgi:hypothetical protein
MVVTTTEVWKTSRLRAQAASAGCVRILAILIWSALAPLVSAEEPLADACSAPEPAAVSAAEDYRDHLGKTISVIRFRTLDVFDTSDPRENNKLYRFFNWLHIDTRLQVIESQLLFRTGETVDADRVAESERLLRTRPYLGNAFVQVDAVCGDQVALLVVTRDIWTLDPQVSAGREGGENKHGFGFSEENLFGTGTTLTIGYDKDRDRSSTSVGFYSPHLFNSRWETILGFADTSDGQQTHLSLGQPFYSVQAPWAMGTRNWDVTQDEVIRYRDEDINEYKHSKEFHEVSVAWAFDRSRERAHRLGVGVTQERHIFRITEDTVGAIPVDENMVYPWVEYQYLENQFAVYRNLHLLHQTEDVATGVDLRVRLGYGGSSLDNDHDFVRYQVTYSDLLGVGEHHLLQFSSYLSGRHYQGNALPNERVWGGDIGYHYLEGRKHRWFVQLRYDQGHQLAQHRELTVGGGHDMRGYPVEYQRGDKRYVFRVERRYISDLHLFNLVRLGGVMYVDAGRTWGADYAHSTHLSNVGLGLRMSSSKAKTGKVLHLDLAFPLADKQYVDSFQWVITASSRL